MIDVPETDFEREVLDRSKDVPVVVDVWAPWCAPCRVLGPVLERLAEQHRGAFVLAKVNADECPGVSQALRVQSIPAVRAFRDGQLVAEFVGAQPEGVVREFIAAILPTEADRLARDGEQRVAAGDAAGAEAGFRDALARDPRQARALLGLARLLADRDDIDGALALLERILPGTPVARDAERLAATLRTLRDGAGDDAPLRARIAADPADLAAHLALGRVLAARGEHEAALLEFLEVVRRDRQFEDDAARKAMVDLFEVLGPQNPLVDRFRGELAKALFR